MKLIVGLSVLIALTSIVCGMTWSCGRVSIELDTLETGTLVDGSRFESRAFTPPPPMRATGIADAPVRGIAYSAPAAPMPLQTDLDGRTLEPGRSRRCKAMAMVFLSTECPISNAYVPELNRLAAAFEQRGVEFYGIISDRSATRAEAVEHRAAYEVAFPVLFDATGELLARLQPTHTPEAFVLSPAGAVLYRGCIDDRYASVGRKKPRAQREYFREALSAVAAGRPLNVTRTVPVGCVFEQHAADSEHQRVTYMRDIAPIMNAHCVTCHREGEAAPFALTSYEEVAKRARQIRIVTGSRFMPPWRPVDGFGNFRGERRLSERELDLIGRWAEAGAPQGDPADLPPKPEFAAGWRLGEPDVVYEISEPFDVPADGPDIYQYFVMPSRLRRDRVISAIEFRPGNPRAIHHASFTYDSSGMARQLDAADPGPGYQRFGGPGFLPAGTLGGWAPGVTPRRLPDGIGRLIWEGADLIVQIHYHPTGKPERDQSKLGFHFAPDDTRQFVVELIVANMNLLIPAGASRFRHHASYTLPADTVLHTVSPHMHLLGREMKVTATHPDGRVEPLIWIRDWDFNWQDTYVFSSPRQLPRGTRIAFEATFDNSTDNPFNPSNPPVDVRWGERSVDEMCVCFFDATAARPKQRDELSSHNGRYVDAQLQSVPWLHESYSPFERSGR